MGGSHAVTVSNLLDPDGEANPLNDVIGMFKRNFTSNPSFHSFRRVLPIYPKNPAKRTQPPSLPLGPGAFFSATRSAVFPNQVTQNSCTGQFTAKHAVLLLISRTMFSRPRRQTMKFSFAVMMLVSGASLAVATPASARNYDCSKAGNANKAVCAKVAKPKALTTTRVTKTKTVVARSTAPRSVTTTRRAATRPVAVAAVTRPASTSWFGSRTSAAPAQAAPVRRAPPVNGNMVAWTTKTGKVKHQIGQVAIRCSQDFLDRIDLPAYCGTALSY